MQKNTEDLTPEFIQIFISVDEIHRNTVRLRCAPIRVKHYRVLNDKRLP